MPFIRRPRTRHAVVTGAHLSRDTKAEILKNDTFTETILKDGTDWLSRKVDN
jgi:hypothetical protein